MSNDKLRTTHARMTVRSGISHQQKLPLQYEETSSDSKCTHYYTNRYMHFPHRAVLMMTSVLMSSTEIRQY